MSAQLGVCYYPEHWPEERWSEDAEKMRALGLSWVRIGEFAWSRIEPKPGEFDWSWLDRAIAVLSAAGLKIVLGTPTATPPRWMIDQYPDMLAVDKDGRARKFGSRRHYCFSYAPYRGACERIAGEMARRYGENQHIHAWQIDNEYGCHDTILSYSRAARDAFRIWLAEKYGTAAALNRAWGNVFWSMEYNGFDEIDLPNLTVTEPNPSHVMDFRRFSSDQVARFNAAQCNAIRAHSRAPLTHNYMGRITEFDHFEVGRSLDIASWDNYPLGFLEDRSDQSDEFRHQYMRQGDPDFQAFHHDLYRAVGDGRWWVMEQQPGPVNWAPYNPAPLEGMVRLWTWEAIAHGAEVVSYFRWRQAPFGQEQMHAGLQRPDGEWAIGASEIETAAREIAKLPDLKPAPAPVGLVFDYRSAWAWDTQPQGRGFDYFRLVYDTYRALRQLGLSVDILPPTASDFGDRKLVCIPGLFSWTPQLLTAMKEFTCQLLIGPRSGSKTADFQIPTAMPPDLPGFALTVSAVETLRSTAALPLKGGGHIHIWREFIETDLPVLERTMDGAPVLIADKNTHYLAGWADEIALPRMLGALCEKADLKTTQMANGKRQRNFGRFTLHTDYGTGSIRVIDTYTNTDLPAPGGDKS